MQSKFVCVSVCMCKLPFLSIYHGNRKIWRSVFHNFFFSFAQNHSLMQPFTNVKLTLWSKLTKWWICALDLLETLISSFFLEYHVMCIYLTKEIYNHNYFIVKYFN